jgi:hypothetical protein
VTTKGYDSGAVGDNSGAKINRACLHASNAAASEVCCKLQLSRAAQARVQLHQESILRPLQRWLEAQDSRRRTAERHRGFRVAAEIDDVSVGRINNSAATTPGKTCARFRAACPNVQVAKIGGGQVRALQLGGKAIGSATRRTSQAVVERRRIGSSRGWQVRCLRRARK